MNNPALKVKLLLETVGFLSYLWKNPPLWRLCELECSPGESKERFRCRGGASSSGKQSIQVVLPVCFFSRTLTKGMARVQHHTKRNRAYTCEKAVAEDQETVKDRSI